MVKNDMRPIHPGEILREENLIPLDLSVNALAREPNRMMVSGSTSYTIASTMSCNRGSSMIIASSRNP